MLKFILALSAVLASSMPASAQTLNAPVSGTIDLAREWKRCVNENRIFPPDEAIAGCTAVIQSGRETPSNLAIAHTNRGIAYQDKGTRDRDLAIADFTKAIELNPQYVSAYINRGRSFRSKGIFDRALADANKSVELDPKNSTAYAQRAFTHSTKGDANPAIADYTKAIELNPQDAWTYYNRGILYGDRKDYDRAIADYTKAVAVDPNYSSAYNNRGVAYMDKSPSDLDRALVDFNKALAISQNHANSYHNRGIIQERRGNVPGAIVDYWAALRVDPLHQLARDALKRLGASP